MADLTTQQAIESLRGLPPERQKAILGRLSPEAKNRISASLPPPGPQLPVPEGLKPHPQKASQQFMEQGGKDILNLVPSMEGMRKATTKFEESPARAIGGAAIAAGKAILRPVQYLAEEQPNFALSSALGGDPEASQKLRQEGNIGGAEFEMWGRPLALMGLGKIISPANEVLEGGLTSQQRMVRSTMAFGEREQSNIPLDDAKLAHESFADVVRRKKGVGPKGFSALKKETPTTDRSFFDILSGKPLTKSAVERGNQFVLDTAKEGAQIAGEPADQVNAAMGYMDGTEAARNIQQSLEGLATEKERAGMPRYAAQIMERAATLKGKKTLGEIYEIKKSANRLSEMPKDTQDAYDLLDSWGDLASAIRSEVYPRYQEGVQSSMMPGFDLSILGKKEGAAIRFRNGIEKRLMKAKNVTDAEHLSGQASGMAAHGAPVHRAVMSGMVRKAREKGIIPSEAGYVNKDASRITGELSSATKPESVTGISRPPMKQLPGKVRQFTIPTTPVIEEATGVMAQPANASYAGRVPAPEATIPPSESSASIHQGVTTRDEASQVGSTSATIPERLMPRSPLVESVGTTGALQSEPVTGQLPRAGATKSNWQYSSEPTGEASGTNVGGGAMLTTSDPAVARETLAKLESIQNSPRFAKLHPKEQAGVKKAIASLRDQLKEYPTSKLPPKGMTWTPRQTGTLPHGHPLRKAMPSIISDIHRELEDQQ